MYTVIGASGNIGSVMTRALLDKGEKVRVVGRHPGKLQQFVHRGAEALVADVTDVEALTNSFSDSRAAFLMIPPNMLLPTIKRPGAYQRLHRRRCKKIRPQVRRQPEQFRRASA